MWLLVLLLHGVIIIVWLNQRAPWVSPQSATVTLNLLPDDVPRPPPPPRDETPKKQLPQRPVAPRPVSQMPPAKLIVPPVPAATHRSDEQEWIAPPQQVDSGPVARRAPSEYANQVKARITSKVIYPKNALYPDPSTFKKTDPRLLMRERTIEYELVVDRQGNLVSYELDPSCHDDLLCPAAEAAILKAQPYPPPPEGAEQYRIYGHVNFMRPKLSP